MVKSLVSEQFLMCAAFNYFTMMEDDDLVSILDSRQPVGNGNRVLPLRILDSAVWIASSVSVSIFAVASSSTRIFGLAAIVLAKAINCLCPLEKVEPRSVTFCAYPSSSFSMKESAWTNSAALLISASVKSLLCSLILSRVFRRTRTDPVAQVPFYRAVLLPDNFLSNDYQLKYRRVQTHRNASTG